MGLLAEARYSDRVTIKIFAQYGIRFLAPEEIRTLMPKASTRSGSLMLSIKRFWFEQESLDMTLAYLKVKDAESEEAQEHANNSSQNRR